MGESRKITSELRYYLRRPDPYSSDPLKRDEWSISFLFGNDGIVYEILERGTPTQAPPPISSQQNKEVVDSSPATQR